MSVKRFFVFSLPRSGSAWFSQFLTSPWSFCYHEPFAEGSVERLELCMMRRPEPIAGAIDTSAYAHPGDVMSHFPPSQIYVLLRSPADIQRSADDMDLKFDAYGAFKRLEKLMREFELKPIYHSKLDSIDYLESLWQAMLGTGFDAERVGYLMEMNIQRSLGMMTARARRAGVLS